MTTEQQMKSQSRTVFSINHKRYSLEIVLSQILLHIDHLISDIDLTK